MIEEANDARRQPRIGSAMRRQASPFFLFDAGFLANSRWRRLAKRLPDPDDFNSAVGAFVVALAASRSNGQPDLDVREETDSRFVDDLIAVGLLTPTGFPLKPWKEYAPSRPKYPGEIQAEFLRATEPVTSVTKRTKRTNDTDTHVPSFPLPSIGNDSPTKTEDDEPPARAHEAEPPYDLDLWNRTQRLAEELTGKAFALGGPLSGLGARALDQAGSVGWPAFERAYRTVAAVYTPRPTARQLVFDAEDHLRPVGRAKPPPVELDPGVADLRRRQAEAAAGKVHH